MCMGAIHIALENENVGGPDIISPHSWEWREVLDTTQVLYVYPYTQPALGGDTKVT